MPSDPTPIKQQILAMYQGQTVTLSQFGQLDSRLGILFAEAALSLLRQTGVASHEVTAIACHGQTDWHEPDGAAPCTLQAGIITALPPYPVTGPGGREITLAGARHAGRSPASGGPI